MLLIVRQNKVSSPYYTGNDRFLWPSSQRPAALLPTPPMPEQMGLYLNLVKGKIGAVASYYKMAYKGSFGSSCGGLNTVFNVPYMSL